MARFIDWPLIRDGAAFQSLINTLLDFEYRARPFDRPGKDAGQDALSGDKQTAYQAKHHKSATISTAIQDALRELKKIKAYKTPGHVNEPHWHDIKKWVLVSNIYINPNDMKKWESQIVPEFAQCGLEASLWSNEIIEPLLVKYPDVYSHYFEGENREFLTIGEAYEQLRNDRFGERGLDIELYGREQELKQVETFLLDEKKVLPIHGSGGVGKSRFLYEAGLQAAEEGWQVLWANVDSLTTGKWYQGIPSGRNTLVLLDEPKDPKIVEILIEQISIPRSRLATWKAIIATRTSNDPILRILQNPRRKIFAEELPLPLLTHNAAAEVALALLKESFSSHNQEELKNISQELAKRLGGFPIWIVVAVNLLKEKGSLATLPKNSTDLAQDYLENTIESSSSGLSSPEELRTLIRWIALFRVLNIEDQELLDFLFTLPDFPSKNVFRRCLPKLKERGLLIARGIDQRLHEIKPDVMRDYILTEWLTVEDNNARILSGEAEDLVEVILKGYNNGPIPKVEVIIQSLAHTELIEKLSNNPIPLLDPIIEGLRRLSLEGSTRDQKNVVLLLDKFSFARVNDTVSIIQCLRETIRPKETWNLPLWGDQSISHEDIIESLPWALFIAAKYAMTAEERREVIEEMCALIMAEVAQVDDVLQRYVNDGQRAYALLPRIIVGEPHFWGNYAQEAFEITIREMKRLFLKEPLSPGHRNLLKALLEPQLSIERQDESSGDDYTIHFRRYRILLNSPEGNSRKELKTKLREVICTSGAAKENKLFVWNLLSESHRNANAAIRDGTAEYLNDLEEDLRWILEMMGKTSLSIKELKAARDIWEWHYEFDKDPTFKSLAKQCEAKYLSNSLASKFHPLFSYSDTESMEKIARDIGNDLSYAINIKEILSFIDEADKFENDRSRMYPAFSIIAQILGQNISNNPVIEKFIFTALKHSANAFEFKFALMVAKIWLKLVRSTGRSEELREILENLLKTPHSKFDKQQLLYELYNRPHPEVVGILNQTDLTFIESHLDVFSDLDNKEKLFLILGHLFFINWDRFTALVEQEYKDLPSNKKAPCLNSFFEGIHYITIFRHILSVDLKPEQLKWIFNQMLLLPDMGAVGNQWWIDDLLKKFGRLPLPWLIQAIRQRINLYSQKPETKQDQESYILVSYRFKLTKFVVPVDEASENNSSVKQLVEELLSFNNEQNLVGHALPEYAADVDPTGIFVPKLVKEKLETLPDEVNEESVWRWSRYAGHYPESSTSWRIIAKAACQLGAQLNEREQISIYSSLEDAKPKVRSWAAGEMNPWYENRLKALQKLLAEETDIDLMNYWRWAVKKAQVAFERAFEEFQEEQGK